MSIKQNVANFISKKISDNGYRQIDIAGALDVHPSVVSHWACGRSNPTVENIQKLSDLFGCDPAEIVSDRKCFSNSSLCNLIASLSKDECDEVEKFIRQNVRAKNEFLAHVIDRVMQNMPTIENISVNDVYEVQLKDVPNAVITFTREKILEFGDEAKNELRAVLLMMMAIETAHGDIVENPVKEGRVEGGTIVWAKN